MRRWTGLALVAMASATLVVGCGDDGDDDVDAAGDVNRYCELTEELDAAGTAFFEDLEANESATDDDYAAAEAAFIEEHKDDFDELLDVVPDELRDDLQVILDGQERRAEGNDEPIEGAEEAEERVLDFEAESCT